MQAVMEQLRTIVEMYPTLVKALAVLVLGWLASLIISALVRAALHRTELDNRLVNWLRGEEAAKPVEAERMIARGVYYLLLLFVLVAFFQVLGLTLITEPLNRLLSQVFEYLPRIAAAAILLIVAWMVATVVWFIVSRALRLARVDERLGRQIEGETEAAISVERTIADALYWIIFLLFLPAVLDALALQGLLEPVQAMLNKVLAFLPNLFSALLILALGWFIARVVERIVTHLSAAVGIDRLGERIGLVAVMGQRLSRVLGLIVYVLILIPVLIAALDALALEVITRPASDVLRAILAAFPALFAAALVLAIAYIIGRVVASWITRLLEQLGFNALPARLGLARPDVEPTPKPAEIVGYVTIALVMLLASVEAARLLGFEGVAAILSQVLRFAGNVVLALIILALGLWLAHLVARVVRASGAEQAGLLAVVARTAIIVVAAAMALQQMGLAREIVNLTFGLLVGAVAVAVALAFGLGGRDVAARLIERWVQRIQKP